MTNDELNSFFSSTEVKAEPHNKSSTNASSTSSTSTSLIDLGSQKFNVFMTVLNILGSTNQDVMIKEGTIRQWNDKKNVIFEFDLSKILGNNDLTLSNIFNKYKSLEIYKKQNSDMSIDFDKNYYIFKDLQSEIYFQKTNAEQISNKYMDKLTFNTKFKINNELKLLDYNISKPIAERLYSAINILEATTVVADFENDNVFIKVIPPGGTNVSIFKVAKIDTSAYDYKISGEYNFVKDAFGVFSNLNDMDENTEISMYKMEKYEYVYLALKNKISIRGTEEYIPFIMHTFGKENKKQ